MTALTMYDSCGAIFDVSACRGVIVVMRYSSEEEGLTPINNKPDSRDITPTPLDLCETCRLALARFLGTVKTP